jgi:hypothetical protein
MTTDSFPAATFVIEGDPEAVRDSGRAYGRFAATAGEAATSLRGLDSGAWVGSEGDLFRARLSEVPPHLDVAHGAFSQVARALDSFADTLAAAQGRMAAARADAEQTLASLAGARADRLQGTWDEQLAVAAGIRAQVLEAARQTGASIRAAGRTSPTAGQGWLADSWHDVTSWVSDPLEDLKDFVAEHASGLRLLAKGLRWVGIAMVAIGAAVAAISFVAGYFSLGIGWLGEIPAGALIGVGMALWGAGDTLDTTIDWAEGKVGGREFLFRAGFAVLTAFAGSAVAKLSGKALDRLAPELAEKLRRWIDDLVKPADEGNSGPAGMPANRLAPDVDHAAVGRLVDQVEDAAAGQRALDELARTFGVSPERFRALAADPAKGGAIHMGGAEEAAAILGAERRGLLPEGMVRSRAGGADFEAPPGTHWPGGREWDVKSFRSTVPSPSGRGAFELGTAVRAIRRELAAGESLLLNTVHLTPGHVEQLRRAVAANGWNDRVVFYP